MEINNMLFSLWKKCLTHLKLKLPPEEFSMWILPLKVVIKNNIINLYAPNHFVFEWVKKQYIKNFKRLLNQLCATNPPFIILQGIHKNFTTICKNKNVYAGKKKKNN